MRNSFTRHPYLILAGFLLVIITALAGFWFIDLPSPTAEQETESESRSNRLGKSVVETSSIEDGVRLELATAEPSEKEDMPILRLELEIMEDGSETSITADVRLYARREEWSDDEWEPVGVICREVSHCGFGLPGRYGGVLHRIEVVADGYMPWIQDLRAHTTKSRTLNLPVRMIKRTDF